MHLTSLPIPSRIPIEMRVPALVTQGTTKLQRFCTPPAPSLKHVQAQKDTHIHKASTQEPRCTYWRQRPTGQVHTVIQIMYPHTNTIPQKKYEKISCGSNFFLFCTFSHIHPVSPFLAHNCPNTCSINLPKYSHSDSCFHYELYIITSGWTGDPIWSMTSLYSKMFRDLDCVSTVCACEKATGGAVFCASIVLEAALRHWQRVKYMHTVVCIIQRHAKWKWHLDICNSLTVHQTEEQCPAGGNHKSPFSEVIHILQYNC